MKRTAFNVIISILLLLVSLAALAAGAFGGLECYALKTADEQFSEAYDSADMMEEAIALLKEHDAEYLEGVEICFEGDKQLLDGRNQLYQKQVELSSGKKQLDEAQAEYNNYNAQLQEAKAQYAEAEAMMNATRSDYEEGKQLVSSLEKLMPYVNTYNNLRSGVLSRIPGFASVEAWFAATVIPVIAREGLEMPADASSFPEYIAEQTEKANSLLAEYEAAEAMLADAKEKIDFAESQLAYAKSQLDKGYSELSKGNSLLNYAQGKLNVAADKLEEGEATLDEYEAAIGTVKDAVVKCLETESICDRNGNVSVRGVAERLDEDFDIYLYNDEGEMLALPNGEARLDYDKCMQVCAAFREYIADFRQDMEREANLRIALDAGIVILSIFGIFAAIPALRGRAKAPGRGLVLFIALAALNIYGFVVGYASFTYPQDKATYQGIIPMLGLWALTLMSLIFMIVTQCAKRKAAEYEVADEDEFYDEDEYEDEDEDAPEEEPVYAAVQKEAEEREVFIPDTNNVEDELADALREYEEALRKYKELYKK